MVKIAPRMVNVNLAPVIPVSLRNASVVPLIIATKPRIRAKPVSCEADSVVYDYSVVDGSGCVM